MPILLKPDRKPIYDTEPIKNRRSKKAKAKPAKRRKPSPEPTPTLPAIQAPVERGVDVPLGLENLKKEKVGSDGRTESTYYGGADNVYEVIKVLKAWGLLEGFCKGNAIKYMIRAGKKGPALEDLKKAKFYLDYFVTDTEQREKGEKKS